MQTLKTLRIVAGATALLVLAVPALAQDKPAAPASAAAPAAPAPAGDAKYLGTWTLDAAALAETPQFKAMPPEQQKQALAMAAQMAGTMSFEFTKDKLIGVMGAERKEAAYTVKANGADSWIVTTVDEGKTEDATVTLKGDRLTIQTGVDTLTLKRK